MHKTADEAQSLVHSQKLNSYVISSLAELQNSISYVLYDVYMPAWAWACPTKTFLHIHNYILKADHLTEWGQYQSLYVRTYLQEL